MTQNPGKKIKEKKCLRFGLYKHLKNSTWQKQNKKHQKTNDLKMYLIPQRLVYIVYILYIKLLQINKKQPNRKMCRDYKQTIHPRERKFK